MATQLVALTLLLFSVIVDAYAPNRFYPAALLRESPTLLHPRGRSRFYEPKAPLAVEPRIQTVRDEEAATDQPSKFPLLSLRDKRLMGIFRCYGWGPGCSDRSLMARSRPGETENPSSTRSLAALQQATSNGNTKFEPFFTLTSGGTWGPTGKKRNGFRRHSVAEKRLNFLKQILRDMLEDIDEEDSRDELRSLGLRSRTKRSASSNNTRRFLTEVARLKRRTFGHSKTISAEKDLGSDNYYYSLLQRS